MVVGDMVVTRSMRVDGVATINQLVVDGVATINRVVVTRNLLLPIDVSLSRLVGTGTSTANQVDATSIQVGDGQLIDAVMSQVVTINSLIVPTDFSTQALFNMQQLKLSQATTLNQVDATGVAVSNVATVGDMALTHLANTGEGGVVNQLVVTASLDVSGSLKGDRVTANQLDVTTVQLFQDLFKETNRVVTRSMVVNGLTTLNQLVVEGGATMDRVVIEDALVVTGEVSANEINVQQGVTINNATVTEGYAENYQEYWITNPTTGSNWTVPNLPGLLALDIMAIGAGGGGGGSENSVKGGAGAGGGMVSGRVSVNATTVLPGGLLTVYVGGGGGGGSGCVANGGGGAGGLNGGANGGKTGNVGCSGGGGGGGGWTGVAIGGTYYIIAGGGSGGGGADDDNQTVAHERNALGGGSQNWFQSVGWTSTGTMSVLGHGGPPWFCTNSSDRSSCSDSSSYYSTNIEGGGGGGGGGGLYPGHGQNVYNTEWGASGGGHYTHSSVSNALLLNGQEGTGSKSPNDRIAHTRGTSPYEPYGNGGGTGAGGSNGALRIRLVIDHVSRYNPWTVGTVSINQLQVNNRSTVLNQLTVNKAVTANVLSASNLTVDGQFTITSLNAQTATLHEAAVVSSIQGQTLDLAEWVASTVTVNNGVTATTIDASTQFKTQDMGMERVTVNAAAKTNTMTATTATMNQLTVTQNLTLNDANIDTLQSLRITMNASTTVNQLVINNGAIIAMATVVATGNSTIAQATVTGSLTVEKATIQALSVTRSLTLDAQMVTTVSILAVTDPATIPTVNVSIELTADRVSINQFETTNTATITTLQVTQLVPANTNQFSEWQVATLSIPIDVTMPGIQAASYATINRLAVTHFQTDAPAFMSDVRVWTPVTANAFLSVGVATVSRTMTVGQWNGVQLTVPTLNATSEMQVQKGWLGVLQVQGEASIERASVPTIDIIAATSNGLGVTTLRWNQPNNASLPDLVITMPLESGSNLSSVNHTNPGRVTWVIPDGVYAIAFRLVGGGGGGGGGGVYNAYPDFSAYTKSGASGGSGGMVWGTLAVMPGQVLTIDVGQGGQDGVSSAGTRDTTYTRLGFYQDYYFWTCPQYKAIQRQVVYGLVYTDLAFGGGVGGDNGGSVGRGGTAGDRQFTGYGSCDGASGGGGAGTAIYLDGELMAMAGGGGGGFNYGNTDSLPGSGGGATEGLFGKGGNGGNIQFQDGTTTSLSNGGYNYLNPMVLQLNQWGAVSGYSGNLTVYAKSSPKDTRIVAPASAWNGYGQGNPGGMVGCVATSGKKCDDTGQTSQIVDADTTILESSSQGRTVARAGVAVIQSIALTGLAPGLTVTNSITAHRIQTTKGVTTKKDTALAWQGPSSGYIGMMAPDYTTGILKFVTYPDGIQTMTTLNGRVAVMVSPEGRVAVGGSTVPNALNKLEVSGNVRATALRLTDTAGMMLTPPITSKTSSLQWVTQTGDDRALQLTTQGTLSMKQSGQLIWSMDSGRVGVLTSAGNEIGVTINGSIRVSSHNVTGNMDNVRLNPPGTLMVWSREEWVEPVTVNIPIKERLVGSRRAFVYDPTTGIPNEVNTSISLTKKGIRVYEAAYARMPRWQRGENNDTYLLSWVGYVSSTNVQTVTTNAYVGILRYKTVGWVAPNSMEYFVTTYNMLTNTTVNYTIYSRRSNTPIPQGWDPCVSTLGHYQLKYKIDNYQSTYNQVIRDDYRDQGKSVSDDWYVTRNASGVISTYNTVITVRIPEVKLCTARFYSALWGGLSDHSPIACDFIVSDDTSQLVNTATQRDYVWTGGGYREVPKDPAEPAVQVNGVTVPSTLYKLKTTWGGERDNSSSDCHLDSEAAINQLKPVDLGVRADGKRYYRTFMLLKKR